MKKNIGNSDKIARFILASVLLILIVTNVVTGTLAIVLLAFAGILVITSILNFCPLYVVLWDEYLQKKTLIHFKKHFKKGLYIPIKAFIYF